MKIFTMATDVMTSITKRTAQAVTIKLNMMCVQINVSSAVASSDV